ncbi:hypothetical protein ACFY2H_07845 [Streptomyces griseofuscus]|uniref:hypothetical protein n=1 Tax=Streptomyces griseofuscus TaxID=146922 RepID=UPI0036A5EEC7
MSSEDLRFPTAKHWQGCTDVHDFLDQIRLRPDMWLSGGSLHDLQTMLIGYQVAVGVHSIDEGYDFWHGGAFSQWLGTHRLQSTRLGSRHRTQHPTRFDPRRGVLPSPRRLPK